MRMGQTIKDLRNIPHIYTNYHKSIQHNIILQLGDARMVCLFNECSISGWKGDVISTKVYIYAFLCLRLRKRIEKAARGMSEGREILELIRNMESQKPFAHLKM